MVSFENLSNLLPSSVKILQQTESDIVFSVQTGSFSNNFEMCKCVTLRKNGDWTLSVNNTTVNLEKMRIEPKYTMSKEGIETVLKIIDSIRICEGIKVNSSVICSRYHTIEVFNKHGENHERKMRSLNCQKVVSLTGKILTCLTCQKMSFTEKGKSQRIVLQEINVNEPSKEEELQRLMPSAPKKNGIISPESGTKY